MELKPGYKHTDVGVIPDAWDVSTFAEVFKIAAGGDVDPKRSASYQDETHRYPIYSNALTSCGLYGYCSYADHPAGSITITARGTLGAANFRDHAYTAIGRVVVLHPKREIAGRFFAEIINSRVKFAIESTGVPQLTAPQIAGYRLPVPPLPEQRAIAATLSDMDALISGLENLIAKKRDLKRAAMQQLLTGQRRLPGFHGEWKVKAFADLAVPRRGRVDPRRAGVQRFCVELEHIEQGTARLLGSTSAGDQSSLKSMFQAGDVLFGKLRAYLRKYWLADRPGVCSTEIWALMANRQMVTPEFLLQLVKSDRFIETASNAYGTHMPRSDWNVVKNYEVQWPQLPEQTTIASVLSDMDAEIAALEQRRDKAGALKEGMMQELLTGRTRLDNPPKVLLKTLKAP